MPGNNKRVLVVGATGGLGRKICQEVIRLLGRSALVIGDYKQERGKRYAASLGKDVQSRHVNVRDRGSIAHAVKDVDAVIVAVKQASPQVQSTCIEKGVSCLDITFDEPFVQQISALHESATEHKVISVFMAGLYPGFSGIMAQWAARQVGALESVDVCMVQNTNSKVGTTGVADMLGLFSDAVVYQTANERREVRGLSFKRRFTYPDPFGSIDQWLVNYTEANVVRERLNSLAVNYWTGFNVPAFNYLVRGLNSAGLLKLFKKPDFGEKVAGMVNAAKNAMPVFPETVGVLVDVKGNAGARAKVALIGPSDYGATATCAVAMTKQILEGIVQAPGVHHPMDVFEMDALLTTMDGGDITCTKYA